MTTRAPRVRFPLYLRVWLAVIVAVALLTLAFGALWELYRDQIRSEQAQSGREVVLRDDAGRVLGQGTLTRAARGPGQGFEGEVALADGRTVVVQIPPRQRRPGEGPGGMRPYLPRGAGGLFWLLGRGAAGRPGRSSPPGRPSRSATRDGEPPSPRSAACRRARRSRRSSPAAAAAARPAAGGRRSPGRNGGRRRCWESSGRWDGGPSWTGTGWGRR